jgi:hypothetical protein
MRTLLRAGRVAAGLLACLLAPAVGLGLLVGRHAGPALGLLALALAAAVLMLGQAWDGLAVETREAVALGATILALQFAGGVLVRQALIAWTARGALAQGALAGAALALGLVWLPDLHADRAAQAPAPPAEARALLLGLDRALAHTPRTALADAARVAEAMIVRVATRL